MNRAGELDLLGGQIAVRIVRKLLAQDQNAVERSSQFMGHVGKKLRLVFGSESQFFSLFFDGTAGLINFLVLTFDLHVLLSKLLGLLRELFVGLLQFFLLRLKLGSQLLRLL